ncbi:MAG TPA: hypothetical protein VLD35_19095 [Caldimonas sp.]|nr:hypothetical protein [Caldimonas sp.]
MACLAVLSLALATHAGASLPTSAAREGAPAATPVSLAQAGTCKPGFVEELLNGWLDSTRTSDFESDYAAMAFAELVDFVNLLRDIAQDFCV